MADLVIDSKELYELNYQLTKADKKKLIPGAVASSMNRAVTHTKRQTSKFVREEYAIKSKDVNVTLHVKKASKRTMTASIESKGLVMPLTAFPHTPTRPTKTRRPVKVKIKKQGAKKEVEVKPGAFVMKTKSGKNQIVHRRGSERLPVDVLTTLSVPQMVGNEEVKERIRETALKKYEERIHHEIDYRLKKLEKQSKGRG